MSAQWWGRLFRNPADPGLFAARELFDFPVVGMSEAAMLTACMLGGRFAIVTFTAALRPWFTDCVAAHGMTDRCAAVRTLDGAFASIADVGDEKESLLVELAKLGAEPNTFAPALSCIARSFGEGGFNKPYKAYEWNKMKTPTRILIGGAEVTSAFVLSALIHAREAMKTAGRGA